MAAAFSYAGRMGLDEALGQLFSILLVYYIHNKQSRTAAIIIFTSCMFALINDGSIALGFNAPLLDVTYTYEASVLLFIQSVLSIIFLYRLTAWTFEFHRLNESKTNWGNAAIVTGVTLAYLFVVSFLMAIAVNNALFGLSEAIYDAITVPLALLIIMAGSWRKLPGTRRFAAIIFKDKDTGPDKPGTMSSESSRRVISTIAGGSCGLGVLTWVTGELYTPVMMAVVFIVCLIILDFKLFQTSKR